MRDENTRAEKKTTKSPAEPRDGFTRNGAPHSRYGNCRRVCIPKSALIKRRDAIPIGPYANINFTS